MKRFSFILIFIFSIALCNAQEAVFKTLISKSQIIVKGTVLETGRKFSTEDGVWNYCVLCKIEESYKGTYKAGDSIRIEITEFSYSEKIDHDSDSSGAIQNGKTLVFFLNKQSSNSVPMCSGLGQYSVNHLVDLWLGVQVPTPQMIFYLKNIAKPH